MHYDISAVGFEYMIAEECFKKGDLNEAVVHYKNAIFYYENADNVEVIPNPDAPYSITEFGKTINYPSIIEMVNRSLEQIGRIKPNDKWFSDYDEMYGC